MHGQAAGATHRTTLSVVCFDYRDGHWPPSIEIWTKKLHSFCFLLLSFRKGSFFDSHFSRVVSLTLTFRALSFWLSLFHRGRGYFCRKCRKVTESFNFPLLLFGVAFKGSKSQCWDHPRVYFQRGLLSITVMAQEKHWETKFYQGSS